MEAHKMKIRKKSHSKGKPSRFKRGKFRPNRPALLGVIVTISITFAVGWVIWNEYSKWDSTTHIENMVGKVWKIKAADGGLEIGVNFEETGYDFAYEGPLPIYVQEGEYIRALFQFSPDNDRIVEFLGPAEEPGVHLPFSFTLLAILGIIVCATVIVYFIMRDKPTLPLPRGGA